MLRVVFLLIALFVMASLFFFAQMTLLYGVKHSTSFVRYALRSAGPTKNTEKQSMPVAQPRSISAEANERDYAVYVPEISSPLCSANDSLLFSQGPERFDKCIITTSTWQDFGFVKTLYDTAIKHDPEPSCFVWFVADASRDANRTEMIKSFKGLLSMGIQVVLYENMQSVVPVDLTTLSVYLSRKEFSLSISLVSLWYSLNVLKIRRVVQLDPATCVSNSLSEVFDRLSSFSVVVSSLVIPTKISAGSMNAAAKHFNDGFIGMQSTQCAIRLLDTLIESLKDGFTKMIKNGKSLAWTRFLPIALRYEDLYVFDRKEFGGIMQAIHVENGLPMINEKPVAFVQFKGLIQEQQHASGSNTSLVLSDAANSRLGDFGKRYIGMLESNNASTWRALRYELEYIEGGVKINSVFRSLLSEALDVFKLPRKLDSKYLSFILKSSVLPNYRAHASFADPDPSDPKFSLSKLAFIDWLLAGPYDLIVNMEGDYYFSELEHSIWKSQPNLQKRWPDPMGNDYIAFKKWFESSVQKDHGLNSDFLALWKAKYALHIEMKDLYLPEATTLGVNVFAWHNGVFGLAKAGADLFFAMQNANVSSLPIRLAGAQHHAHEEAIVRIGTFSRSISAFPINVFSSTPDSFAHVLIHELLPQHVRRDYYNIAYWVWELEVMPDEWMKNAIHFDEIWTPTIFAKHSIINSKLYNISTPVHIIPYSLGDKNFRKDAPIMNTLFFGTAKILPSDFLFLVVFDYQSSFARKNPIASLRAFQEAFEFQSSPFRKSNSTPVLIIKSVNSATDVGNYHLLKATASNSSQVHFVDDHLSETDIHALRNRADCYVSLHRAEGAGLNVLESMAMGKPVIATDYSGSRDFFDVDRSLMQQLHFPIPFSKVAPVPHKIPNMIDYSKFIPNQTWAEPSHAHAVAAMKKVFANGRNFRDAQMQKSIDVLKNHFSHSAVGKLVHKHLENYQSFISQKIQSKRGKQKA